MCLICVIRRNSHAVLHDFNSFVTKFGEKNVLDYKKMNYGDIKINFDIIPYLIYEFLGYVKPILGLNKKCIVLDLDSAVNPKSFTLPANSQYGHRLVVDLFDKQQVISKTIEKIAIERGHSIVAKIDKNSDEGKLSEADVAINFSVPDAAVTNIKSALKLEIPVVCGTTGWLEDLKEVELNGKDIEQTFQQVVEQIE